MDIQYNSAFKFSNVSKSPHDPWNKRLSLLIAAYCLDAQAEIEPTHMDLQSATKAERSAELMWNAFNIGNVKIGQQPHKHYGTGVGIEL